MARLERLTVYPIKGLDGITLDAAEVREGGTISYDREFALFDADGEVLNGVRTDLVHQVRTEFDTGTETLTVTSPDGEAVTFDLHEESERVEAWFGDVFGVDLTLERDRSRGFVDRPGMGPSVISTATVEEIASWFDEMDVEGARRRFRANVEVSGVPAFWEDRFVGEGAPDFEIGDVGFEGVTPCGRCVVPERDPDTGEAIDQFRDRFLRNRRDTFPDWASTDAFDHYYTAMILTRIPETDRGRTLEVGQSVTVLDQ